MPKRRKNLSCELSTLETKKQGVNSCKGVLFPLISFSIDVMTGEKMMQRKCDVPVVVDVINLILVTRTFRARLESDTFRL